MNKHTNHKEVQMHASVQPSHERSQNVLGGPIRGTGVIVTRIRFHVDAELFDKGKVTVKE